MLVCSKSITKQVQWNLSLKQNGQDHYTTFTETYICCALSYKNSLYWVLGCQSQALQPIRGANHSSISANQRLPSSQSEVANHSSTSANQRLPITYALQPVRGCQSLKNLANQRITITQAFQPIRLRITSVLQPITQVLQPIRTPHTLFCMKSPKSAYHDCLTSQSTAAEPEAG